jgi:hypothetical protein
MKKKKAEMLGFKEAKRERESRKVLARKEKQVLRRKEAWAKESTLYRWAEEFDEVRGLM